QHEELPADIPVYQQTGTPEIIDLLVKTKLAGSRADAKRLIEQGGVAVDEKIVKSNEPTEINDNSIIRVGKRKFVKIRIS
ncbi:MAG: S4 domain-containing protein, partial [bacterium]|nr:S4 domain-containing protein [bacterium]